jgi:hypothetical protein
VVHITSIATKALLSHCYANSSQHNFLTDSCDLFPSISLLCGEQVPTGNILHIFACRLKTNTFNCPTSRGRSVGIVRSRTKATELVKCICKYSCNRNVILLKLNKWFKRETYSRLGAEVNWHLT